MDEPDDRTPPPLAEALDSWWRLMRREMARRERERRTGAPLETPPPD